MTGEVCDDGTELNGLGCLSDCTGSINGWTCTGGTYYTSDFCSETCGDTFITISEVCEDGNNVALDGCSSVCLVESGWTCTPTYPSVCKGICGDGKVKPGEICDDGNTSDFDKC